MMTADRWKQINEIFHSALGREPKARPAYLAGACATDESLRREVEALIAAHEKEGGFIDSPAYDLAAEMLAGDQLELAPGQTFGHYEILSQLGRGGMGEVYLALDRGLNRKVALKLLPASFIKDAERLRRFEREARAASSLNHPNIITIHEIGQANSLHFIATEFVEGETLRELLSRTRPGLRETLHIAVQAADAIAAAHRAGIVHRDVKPENIMLRPDGYVKVLDFGLAKLVEQTASGDSKEPTLMQFKTSPGAVMGTAAYMSPEQALGLEVDERTDVWSLGCVLYEMLAGRQPFEGMTASHVIVNIIEKEPQWAPASAGEGPAELEWIVRKALRKERDERYQTAKELLGDLRSLKQRVEFRAELERAQSPETKVSPIQAGGEKQFATGGVKAAVEASETHPPRSTKTEILAGKLKQNKPALALAVASLVLIVGAIGYRFFIRRE
ncbi:MAG TPA: protein kinase, partial [Pyrinomonadaceae bacterium]